jgi:hypothetical protein
MKHPVLRIRKETPFYDDTNPARTVSAGTDGPPRHRGRLGRMVFLPLVVLALAVAVVVSLAPTPGTARFPGWDVRLQAVIYGDMLLVAFTFSPRGPVPSVAPRADLHVVLPDTGSAVDLSGDLRAPSTIIRGQLPMTDAVRKVRAEITIGADHRVLTLGSGSSRPPASP